MKPSRFLWSLLFAGLVPVALAQNSAAPAPAPAPAPAAPAQPNKVFGPYEAIVFDDAMLQGVKVDDAGNVFIMFQPDKRDAQIHIRISNEQGSDYRKWFNGQEDLVAQENIGRGPNLWTDEVNTSANYIEYWAGDHLFLHLKKIKQ